jgi:hypothetical protein
MILDKNTPTLGGGIFQIDTNRSLRWYFFSYAVKKVHNRCRDRRGEKIAVRAPEPIPQYIVAKRPNITDCHGIPLSDCRFCADLRRASPSVFDLNDLRLKHGIILGWAGSSNSS